MKTKIIRLILFSHISAIIFSCHTQDDESIGFVSPQQSETVIINDPSSFRSRVAMVNRTANMDYIGKDVPINGRTLSSGAGSQIDYFWYHIASVTSPVVNGQTLSATHFDLIDDYAYVSYHKQGNVHLGAVEILDLSSPYQPQVVSQMSFNNADINALTAQREGGIDKIWLATSHAKHGAVVFHTSASSLTFQDELEKINLSNHLNDGVSASANGICFGPNEIIVTSGKTYGGSFLINKGSLDVSNVSAFTNAKYASTSSIAGTDYAISLITGDNSSLYVQNLNDLSSYSHSIGSITHSNVEATYRGKSTMEVSPLNNREIMVAMGAEGVRSFDIISGENIRQSKGTMLLAGNTNGVTMDDDFIYMANGADGMAVAEHSDGEFIDPVFHWDTAPQPASVNFVKAEGDYLFVAKGEGGFHILQKIPKEPYMTLGPYNDRGKPLVMEEDIEVCSQLLTTIFTEVLPERVNVINTYPQYFEYPSKNIVMREDGEVTLTFIHEGAGYKNILGYYTYQEDNPPTSIDELEKIIIFPNASAVRSGGDLVPGNTMRLLGEFKKGTVIGFFLIANGWKGKITDGFYTQYTDIPHNSSGRQQSLIFHDLNCSSTVICFEDITVPNGDNDFNDAIFQINTYPPTAIDTDEYYQIE